MSVDAVQRVYPSLDRGQVDQLRRTFRAKSYQQETRIGRVAVANESATVQATISRRIVTESGDTVDNQSDAEFRLQRSGGTWVIVGVTVR
jgi:hypothetical protein